MFSVYVLRSLKNRRFYTGSTGDFLRRLSEHNNGQNPSTRAHRPYVLVHLESYPTRTEALQRERFLKTGKGREELTKLIHPREAK